MIVSRAASRVVAALSLAVLGAPAAAAGATLPTAAIAYVAPPECPGAAAFLALLEDRTAGAWDVRLGANPPDLVVEIRNDAAGKVGRVRRPGRAGEGAREIAAADCRNLVEALALSTALSLDQAAGAAATAATLATTAAAAAAAEPSAWTAGAGLETTFLIPSQPMPEASLFVQRGRRAWPAGPAIGSPDVRLTIAHARNDLFAGGDRARFALSSAQLALCPAALGFGATAGLRLCAAGDLGMLSGEGVDVTTPRTTRFLWAAAGAVMRLAWAPGRRLRLEAQAALVAPFERTTFVLEMPRVAVARVAPLVVSAGLTVGLAIP